jgi:hypothetical protein
MKIWQITHLQHFDHKNKDPHHNIVIDHIHVDKIDATINNPIKTEHEQIKRILKTNLKDKL